MSPYHLHKRSSRLAYILLFSLVLILFKLKQSFETFTTSDSPRVTFNLVKHTTTISTPSSGVYSRIINKEYGLGNQLFFFSICYALSKSLGIPLLLPFPKESPTRDYSEQHKNTSNRDYVLKYFSLPGGIYTDYRQFKTKNLTYKVTCEMAKNISLISQEALENYKFFKFKMFCFDFSLFEKYENEIKEIKVNLEIPSEGYKIWRQLIGGEQWPVAVHIRKGDLSKDYWIPSIDYFKEGIIEMIKKTPDGLESTFYVFSDEMEWAREGLNEGFFLDELQVPIYFVTGTFGGLTNLEEFDLMTKCKSIIISSSTFSWWAAFLMRSGEHTKIVIRPEFNKSWHQTPKDKEISFYDIIYPKDWIALNA